MRSVDSYNKIFIYDFVILISNKIHFQHCVNCGAERSVKTISRAYYAVTGFKTVDLNVDPLVLF